MNYFMADCDCISIWVYNMQTDNALLDQDGQGGYSEQPTVDIPEAKKDV